MNTSHLSSSSTDPSEDNTSSIGFYLLMGALVAGLVLVALLPFFM